MPNNTIILTAVNISDELSFEDIGEMAKIWQLTSQLTQMARRRVLEMVSPTCSHFLLFISIIIGTYTMYIKYTYIYILKKLSLAASL